MTHILCFLDTESTGLDPRVHVPWEVSWTIGVPDYDAGTLTLSMPRTYLVPIGFDQMRDADPVALDIGRFNHRHPQGSLNGSRFGVGTPDGPTIGKILRDDLRYAGAADPKDVTLVGAVPSFDDAMLARWWGGNVNDRPWHYHLCDVETLIAGRTQVAPPWKYGDMLATVGVVEDPAGKHTAAGDFDVVIAAYAKVFALDVIR